MRLHHEPDGSLRVEEKLGSGEVREMFYRRAFVGEKHDFETLPGPDWDEPTRWVLVSTRERS